MCSLGPLECQRHWSLLAGGNDGPTQRRLDDYLQTFQSEHPGEHFYGCQMPKDLCQARPGGIISNQEPQPASCTIYVGRVAIVGWPSTVIASDLCGNDGAGSYQFASSSFGSSPPHIVSTNALTMPYRDMTNPGREWRPGRSTGTEPFIDFRIE
jgi:hypothetical protein